jgi:hypothetical protein
MYLALEYKFPPSIYVCPSLILCRTRELLLCFVAFQGTDNSVHVSMDAAGESVVREKLRTEL